MSEQSNNKVSLKFHDDYWIGSFTAMASPCEILLDTTDKSAAENLTSIAEQEAHRIEQKFSRYREDNIIYQINNSNGKPIKVDDETAALLDYVNHCYELSDGLFDVTSGILRQAWKFDGGSNVPSKKKVNTLLQHIGWSKVIWQRPYLTLPKGMEIDLGGIGKEYAVDKAALLLNGYNISNLVNFGGDLVANKVRANGQAWVVGIEDPEHLIEQQNNKTTQNIDQEKHSIKEFDLSRGGIATSGDTRRFLLKNGKRYSHILDPRTGWPIKNAAHSITVVAGTCTDAGILATLAMLQGDSAEEFLEEQDVMYWCLR